LKVPFEQNYQSFKWLGATYPQKNTIKMIIHFFITLFGSAFLWQEQFFKFSTEE